MVGLSVIFECDIALYFVVRRVGCAVCGEEGLGGGGGGGGGGGLNFDKWYWVQDFNGFVPTSFLLRPLPFNICTFAPH